VVIDGGGRIADLARSPTGNRLITVGGDVTVTGTMNVVEGGAGNGTLYTKGFDHSGITAAVIDPTP
jgi:hypothetical protein